MLLKMAKSIPKNTLEVETNIAKYVNLIVLESLQWKECYTSYKGASITSQARGTFQAIRAISTISITLEKQRGLQLSFIKFHPFKELLKNVSTTFTANLCRVGFVLNF